MGSHPEYAIDLEKILSARTGGRHVSKFVLNALKRFLHVDFFNKLLVEGYEGVEFCTKSMEFMDISLKVEGLERVSLPEGAKITFASNHPLGGADGVALGSIIGTNFSEDLGILVNDFLMNLHGLAPLCVPVNKLGSQSRNMPELIREMYAEKSCVLVFPAGICSRKIDGVIQDKPWTKSFVRLSRENGRYMVPVHFIGQNSRRFYNLDALCKKFGIKFNLPMVSLPDELYRARGKTFRVVFGEPVSPETFDSSRSDTEWAAYLREMVYKLD